MKSFYHSPNLLSRGVVAKIKIVLFTCLSLMTLKLVAQPCVMSCKTGPVFFPLNNGCSKIIDPLALLNLPLTTCAGPKVGIAFDQFNNSIGNNITSTYLGQTLNVNVIDLNSGQSCMTTIMVADTMAPLLICQSDITVNCNKSILPVDLPSPIVNDNCGGFTLTNTDFVNNLPCPQNAIVLRTWKAVDASGNSKTCLTKITMLRPKLSDVEFIFASNFILNCNQDPEDLNVLGQPTLDGNPIDFNGLCDFKAEKSDSTAPAKPPLIGTTYFRTWKVSDLCLGISKSVVQIFTVEDVIAPTIVCPPDIAFKSTATTCINPIFLPAPLSISDNCATNPKFNVLWAFPDQGLGPYNNLPSGTYNVTYQVTDFALNTGQCSFKVTVLDTFPPVAVCKGQVVVALSNKAPSALFPSSVDNGSTDNCNILKYELDRLDDALGFQDSLLFNCADVGDTILVDLKVTDASGLFSICTSKVIVQDKIAPFIICPPDVTVECSDVFGDFTQYGDVAVSEPCLDTIIITIVNQQDNCQVGTILREFQVIDAAGNISLCTQTIYVVNSHPFDGNKIVWPSDYVSNDCITPDHFDPEDLPEPYDKPILPNDDQCALIAIGHEDHIFTVSMPSCYKIMRTWTVMDWCQYHPDIDPNKGIWKHTQLIKIQDTLAPVIACVDTVKGSVGPDCKTGYVKMPLISATDCSPDLKITNNSQYSDAKGPDASGTYPVGTTKVMFTVSDLCGNFSFCTVKVVVKDDKAPGVKCKYGLAADLVYMGTPLIMACVSAKAFDAGTIDNCTPTKDLKFSYSPNPNDTTQCFDCGDLGYNNIQIWVTDANGNQDYCQTFIDIQDNMFPCIPQNISTITLAGSVQTESGKDIEDVKVDLSGDKQTYSMTSDKGSFEFQDLPIEKAFEIHPNKNIAPLNGISTLDMIKLQRHILGQEPLNSPYKLIAADLDGSHKITTNDFLILKKLILHQIAEIPGQESWKFIPKSYVFPYPNNPWYETYPEKFKDDKVMKQNMDVDFIGIKMGDLNNTATATNFNNNETRSQWAPMNFYTNDKIIQADQLSEIIIRSNQAQNLESCQFTLELSDGVKVESIEPLFTDEATDQILNYDKESNKIHFSWYDLKSRHFSENEAIFKIKLKSSESLQLSALLKMSDADNFPEALTDKNEILRPELSIVKKEENKEGFALFQNRPNPFNKQTTIRFQLPESGAATIRVYDITGKTLVEKHVNLPAGFHEIMIDSHVLNGAGVYLYSLETEKQRAVARMILIE